MALRGWIRDHVVVTSILLGILSIVVVFGATLRVLPPDRIPTPVPVLFDIIPHGNALLAAVALAAMSRGFLAIRRGEVHRHRRSMLVALGAFGTFLALYLYNVAVNGPTPFHGPEMIYLYVYLPVLIIHITLAVLLLPFLFYVALIGLTYSVPDVMASPHRRVARPTLLLWAITFVLGLTVYVQLHLLY